MTFGSALQPVESQPSDDEPKRRPLLAGLFRDPALSEEPGFHTLSEQDIAEQRHGEEGPIERG